MGHNLAAAPFTLPGGTEVTNNILALYMQEQRKNHPYMSRVSGTLPKVELSSDVMMHGWSEGDSGLRLSLFTVEAVGRRSFRHQSLVSGRGNSPIRINEDQGWNMFKMAHRKARGDNAGDNGGTNYCSGSASGLSQGDLMMACYLIRLRFI